VDASDECLLDSWVARLDVRKVEVVERPWLDRSRHAFLDWSTRFKPSVRLVARTREHRGVILYRTDYSWVVRPVPDGWLEDDSLVVALTLAFGFDAIGASWSLLAALYATFPACEAPSFCPLSHLGV
jgi:hypothetical protein